MAARASLLDVNMDAPPPHLALDGQMGANQPSNHHAGSISFDFDALMAGTGHHQLSHGLEAIGTYNHDDSCLDPQGLIQCAHAIKAQSSLNGNGNGNGNGIGNAFQKPFQQPNASIMTALRPSQIQTHSRDRHSISNPNDIIPFADQAPLYPWENFFNEPILDTPNCFAAGHQPHKASSNPKKRPACDEDCASVVSCTSCEVDCPSQCGETGEAVCCDDDDCGDQALCLDETCLDTYQPCTDTNCTSLTMLDHSSLNPTISEGDKQAAAALASFGDNQLSFMHNDFSQHFHPHSPLKPTSMPPPSASCNGGMAAYMGLPGASCGNLSLDGTFGTPNHLGSGSQYWQANLENVLASHILQFHDPRRSEAHVRPCIADSKDFFFVSKCTLPKAAAGSDALTRQLESHPCGFQVQNVDQFACHILSDHSQLPISGRQPFNSLGSSQLTGNMANDMSMFSCSNLAASAFQGNAISAGRRHFSPSDSSMPNLSVGSSPPTSPTSLATSPSLKPERFSTEPVSIATPRSASARPTPQPHVAAQEEFICRWRTGQGSQICGMKFKNADELHTHGKFEHLKKLARDEVGFHCAWHDCSRTTSFNQKSKLERHLQTHTGYKPVKCNICGMQLSAKQSLDQHMRTHTGEKPWKCPFEGCTLAFKQQSALTMHERTHTGYKPLVCDICNKSFGESSNLSKHRRTHNTKGMHVCSICNKDFHRLDQLRRHMYSNHKCKPEEANMMIKQSRGTHGSLLRQRGTSGSTTPRSRNGNSMELTDSGLEDLV